VIPETDTHISYYSCDDLRFYCLDFFFILSNRKDKFFEGERNIKKSENMSVFWESKGDEVIHPNLLSFRGLTRAEVDNSLAELQVNAPVVIVREYIGRIKYDQTFEKNVSDVNKKSTHPDLLETLMWVTGNFDNSEVPANYKHILAGGEGLAFKIVQEVYKLVAYRCICGDIVRNKTNDK
jgi:hypothetical protein